MKLNWFKREGIFFIPTSVAGWMIFACAMVYAIYVFMDIDSRSHSVSDTLMNFVFSLLIIGAVYSFVAYLTSTQVKSANNEKSK